MLELETTNNYIIVRYSGTSAESTGRIVLDRVFSKDGKSVAHRSFSLPDKDQGKGISKRVLKQQVAAYIAPGSKLEKITVQTGWEAGGYTWGRFGFTPDASQFTTIRNQVIMKTAKGSAAETLAKDLVRSPNPVSAFRAFVNSESGKSLLSGTTWKGSLDLKDKDSMAIFNAYTK